MSLRQSLIPQAMFGRVQGAYRTLVWGGIALGTLTGGAVATAVGLSGVFLVAGGGLLVMAGCLDMLVRRHAPELTDDALAAEPQPATEHPVAP
jgi:hypothetical protein